MKPEPNHIVPFNTKRSISKATGIKASSKKWIMAATSDVYEALSMLPKADLETIEFKHLNGL